MDVINLFFELARQHIQLKGAYYGKAYGKGAGNSAYPLIWVDDPIRGRAINNAMQYTVNVDFLDLPVEESQTATVQKNMQAVALSFIEKIKQERPGKFSVDSYDWLTLSDYYDDDAAGQRFTFVMYGPNLTARCIDNFDPDKTLGPSDNLPDFLTENPQGCVIFDKGPGLPKFVV